MWKEADVLILVKWTKTAYVLYLASTELKPGQYTEGFMLDTLRNKLKQDKFTVYLSKKKFTKHFI